MAAGRNDGSGRYYTQKFNITPIWHDVYKESPHCHKCPEKAVIKETYG